MNERTDAETVLEFLLSQHGPLDLDDFSLWIAGGQLYFFETIDAAYIDAVMPDGTSCVGLFRGGAGGTSEDLRDLEEACLSPDPRENRKLADWIVKQVYSERSFHIDKVVASKWSTWAIPDLSPLVEEGRRALAPSAVLDSSTA